MAKPSIEDRIAIEDLFIRYTTSLDDFDIAGIESCFVEDCALVTPNHGEFRGKSSIREWMKPNLAVKDLGGRFRHVISNFTMDVNGDHAKAGCYLLDFLIIDGHTKLLSPGIYDCDLVRIGGEWLFERRTVIMDKPYSLPQAQPPAHG
ncbi:nuclear transport factor 2 family protein [Chelatococcus sp. GCM10030263]|uniref:nuclear transport factor 2 family protein n=1 Tax=Chelatococcus sp. GCM10030263 TaxID=3273387 RepID=UPI00361B5145